MEALKEVLYDSLGFIRVYMKPQGEAADLEEPMIVLRNTKVGQICDRLHKDFRRKFRFAYIWGPSAKHPGQRVGLEHKLKDGDVVSVVIQK